MFCLILPWLLSRAVAQQLQLDACLSRGPGDSCSFAGTLNTVLHGSCASLGPENRTVMACVPNEPSSAAVADPQCSRGILQAATGACCPHTCAACLQGQAAGGSAPDSCLADVIIRVGPLCALAGPPCIVAAGQVALGNGSDISGSSTTAEGTAAEVVEPSLSAPGFFGAVQTGGAASEASPHGGSSGFVTPLILVAAGVAAGVSCCCCSALLFRRPAMRWHGGSPTRQDTEGAAARSTVQRKNARRAKTKGCRDAPDALRLSTAAEGSMPAADTWGRAEETPALLQPSVLGFEAEDAAPHLHVERGSPMGGLPGHRGSGERSARRRKEGAEAARGGRASTRPPEQHAQRRRRRKGKSRPDLDDSPREGFRRYELKRLSPPEEDEEDGDGSGPARVAGGEEAEERSFWERPRVADPVADEGHLTGSSDASEAAAAGVRHMPALQPVGTLERDTLPQASLGERRQHLQSGAGGRRGRSTEDVQCAALDGTPRPRLPWIPPQPIIVEVGSDAESTSGGWGSKWDAMQADMCAAMEEEGGRVRLPYLHHDSSSNSVSPTSRV